MTITFDPVACSGATCPAENEQYPELWYSYCQEAQDATRTIYKGGSFFFFYYKRSCFDEYYQLLANVVKYSKKKCLTVTGTPGIGISVFHAYFFERYRKEQSNTEIVAVAFFERKIYELFIAAVGKEPKVLRSLDRGMELETKAEKDVPDKIILYLCAVPPTRFVDNLWYLQVWAINGPLGERRYGDMLSCSPLRTREEMRSECSTKRASDGLDDNELVVRPKNGMDQLVFRDRISK
ncbi:hypothetical protein GQ600_2755 [Phytophthora cactorum]|nr:hypothetical protein GQ600_2755 [Phytophthora cactorum]